MKQKLELYVDEYNQELLDFRRERVEYWNIIIPKVLAAIVIIFIVVVWMAIVYNILLFTQFFVVTIFGLAGLGFFEHKKFSHRDQKLHQLLHASIIPTYLQGFVSSAKHSEPHELTLSSRVLSKPDYKLFDSFYSYFYSAQDYTIELWNTKPQYLAQVEDQYDIVYEGADYKFGEYSIQILREAKNIHYYADYARFLVVRAKVDHDFEGETVLSRKLYWFSRSGLDKVNLESREFAMKFVVYSNNQREARVCLKTNVMQALNDLNPQGKFFMEFSRGYVTIGVEHNAGVFEHETRKKLLLSQFEDSKYLVIKMMELTEKLNINHEYLYKTKSKKN